MLCSLFVVLGLCWLPASWYPSDAWPTRPQLGVAVASFRDCKSDDGEQDQEPEERCVISGKGKG